MSRITSKTMRRNDNFIAKEIFNHFHGCVEKGKFPNCLKLVNVPQVFKKVRVPEKNYRPNSILLFLPISFEKFLVKQYLEILKAILSKLQCGFGKIYCAQHCLLMMLETFIIRVLKHLKVFHCLTREFLIANPDVYGLDLDLMDVLQD